jgi:hypothetical protein
MIECSFNTPPRLNYSHMHRRRFNLPISSLNPLKETTSTLITSSNLIKEELEVLKGFLSPNSTRLLLNSYHLHLRSVAELAFGSPANISQAAKDLFRIVEAGEREEGRMKNPRLLHHASQAWNLDFFLRGLVSFITLYSASFLIFFFRVVKKQNHQRLF